MDGLPFPPVDGFLPLPRWDSMGVELERRLSMVVSVNLDELVESARIALLESGGARSPHLEILTNTHSLPFRFALLLVDSAPFFNVSRKRITAKHESQHPTQSLSLDLELSHESLLLGRGLELSVSVLGGSVDELEVDLLQVGSGGVDHEGLSESEHSLLGSGNATLEDQEVVVDETVVGESSHGVLSKGKAEW